MRKIRASQLIWTTLEKRNFGFDEILSSPVTNEREPKCEDSNLSARHGFLEENPSVDPVNGLREKLTAKSLISAVSAIVVWARCNVQLDWGAFARPTFKKNTVRKFADARNRLLFRFLCGLDALGIKDSSQGAIPSPRCISARPDTQKEETSRRTMFDTPGH